MIKEAQIYNIQWFSTLLNPFVESILPKSELHKPNVGYNAITQRWDKAGHNYSLKHPTVSKDTQHWVKSPNSE